MTILASVNNKTVMPGITPIADVPDTPTIGTATAAGLAASVTFTAATTGGIPTTFTATSNPGSITGTSATSPITVSGLTADTSYTFTVTAGNSTGTSPASAASNSITAIAPLSGGYDALATVIVGSTALSSINFVAIPTGYKHLQIRCLSRNNSAATASSISVGFNNNTTSSYTTHLIIGDGASASADGSTALTKNYSQTTTGNNSPTGVFGAQVIDILDYANTSKNKTLRALSGFDNNGGDGTIRLGSSLWINTSAISSIQIYNYGGSDFIQYSSFALYGVK